MERTDAILRRLEEILKPAPAIANVLTLGGFDLIAGTNNTNVGSLVAILSPWEERESPQLQVDAILARVQREFDRIQGALVFGLTPPPIIGLGTAGGFEFDVQDRAGRDLTELAAATNALLAAARERPELTNMSSPFRVSVPQLSVSLDRDKAETLGVPVTDVYDALQTFLGGVYVNDFNLFGRTWKVLMQADADFRRSPDDVDRFYVRTQDGLMVPLTALISIKTASGPEVVYRYNRYRAARIFGAVAPGYSSGQGSAVMEELAAKVLPAGFGYEWTGTVYQQRKAEGQEPIIFGLSAVLVLLLLAALYESWATPFAVVLARSPRDFRRPGSGCGCAHMRTMCTRRSVS